VREMETDERRDNERSSRETTRQSRRKDVAFALVVTALFVVLAIVALGIVIGLSVSHEAARRDQEQFEQQIAEIRAGRTKCAYLYSSTGTNQLLGQLVDAPEVEEVTLDLTDVTDDGMKSLAELKKLKSLTVCGGRPSVGDAGISYLKTAPNLEHLELINTQVTDAGLSALKDMPSLRSLVLFHEKWREPTFTDAGLVHLKDLTKLEQLNVSGGWASDSAVKELQKAMPKCKIDTKGDNIGR
jgi:hypothetical protein